MKQPGSTFPLAKIIRSNAPVVSSQKAQINVYLFDSTPMDCALLSQALEGSEYGLRVVGCADDAAGIEISLLGQADVAIMSSRLKDGPLAGFALLKQVSKTHPSLQYVMLIDQDERDFVVEAFRSGATGVCARNQTYELLCKCIYCVHHGQVWANSQQLHFVLDALSTVTSSRLTDARGTILLSEREEQVVRLVTEAFTNREIAEHLKISERTVKNHMNHIFDRLGLSNRVELTRYALAQRNTLRHSDSAGLFENETSVAS